MAPFNASTDLERVQGWAAARGVDLRPYDLPRTGFVTDAAAGWLYRTDSGVAFLETFITNPAAPARERHRDIDEIGLALIETARLLGAKRLVSMTTHRSIGRMMVRRGFTYTGPMHVLRLEV